MPEGQMPPVAAEAPAQSDPQGGGVAEFLTGLDKDLLKATQVVSENPEIPDDLKAPLQAAHQAYRQFLEGLLSMGEGGAPEPAGGAVAPEQGASKGAVPVSMGRPA